MCQEVCPVNAQADDTGPLLVPLLPLIAWLLPAGRARLRAGGGRDGADPRRTAPASAQCRRGARERRAAHRRCRARWSRGPRPTGVRRSASQAERLLDLTAMPAPLSLRRCPASRRFAASTTRSCTVRKRRTCPNASGIADDADAPPTSCRPDRCRLPAVRRDRRGAAARAARRATSATPCASSTAPSPIPSAAAAVTRRVARRRHARAAPRAGGLLLPPRHGSADRTIWSSRGCCAARAARAVGRRRSGRTSTPCPVRRPTDSRSWQRPAPSSARSWRSTSTARSGTTTSWPAPGRDEWRARDGDGLLHQLVGHRGRRSAARLPRAPDAVHRRWAPSVRDRARLPGRGSLRSSAAAAAPGEPGGRLDHDGRSSTPSSTELEIRPTHRLLLDADADALRALVRR